jgi:Mg2+-importing ATPase
MAVFGPVSSLFDFMTFYVMLVFLNAGHSEFRSGWFVESLATQTLVVFVIRTRRVPFLRSRPSLAMIALPIACAIVGAILPFTPLAHVLGFASLPLEFFLILLAMILGYLVLVEVVKARFYAVQDRPPGRRPTRAERHHRHVRRRAARFAHQNAPPTTAG